MKTMKLKKQTCGEVMKVNAYPIVLDKVCTDSPLFVDLKRKRIIKKSLCNGVHYHVTSCDTGFFYGWMKKDSFKLL